jgi:polyisoprenoid-binding protein YceI
MRTLILACIGAALFVCSGGRAQAQVRTFKIERNGGGQVQFVSDAPLERITGVSSSLSGEIVVDPAHPASGKANLNVPVSSLRTGVDLRDEHLQSDSWLDAAHFPNITFVIKSISGIGELTANALVEPTIQGTVSIHGIEKPVSTKARVRYIPGVEAGGADMLRVQASFSVRLPDHQVSIPSIVSLKVSPSIQVNVDLRATAEAPAEVLPPVPVAEPAPVEPPAPVAAPEKAKPKGEAHATHVTKPAQETAKPASEPPAHPVTGDDAKTELHAALRKAHYWLEQGDTKKTLHFIQRAQHLLTEIDK